MEFKNLLFETKNKIAVVTINRPDKLNALNANTLDELRNVFTTIKNNENVNAVVITGHRKPR